MVNQPSARPAAYPHARLILLCVQMVEGYSAPSHDERDVPGRCL